MMSFTKREKRLYLSLAGVLAVLVVFAIFFFDPYGNEPATSQSPANGQQQEIIPPPNEYPFTIYFPRLDADGSQSKVVYPLDRQSPEADLARHAVEQLLVGPTPQERADGYFTALELHGESNCGGDDFKLTRDDGSLTLRFCRTVQYENQAGLDLTESQINKTLLGLDQVEDVTILTRSGDCVFTDDESCKDKSAP